MSFDSKADLLNFSSLLFTNETIILTLVLTVLIYLSQKSRRPKSYPPGPLGLPIIGNIHQLGTSPHETLLAMKKKYGSIISVDIGSMRTIILNDYKTIRDIFGMEELSGRIQILAFKERCGGEKMRGLICTDGRLWSEQRRFAHKTLRDFGFGRKSMEILIQNEITELIQYLSDLNGASIQSKCFFNLAVLNSLWSIITGKRFALDDKNLINLVKYITKGIDDVGLCSLCLFFPALAKIAPDLTGYNNFLDYNFKSIAMVQEEVNEHKATFQSGHLRDLVDAFIQENIDTTDENSSMYKAEGEKNMVITLTDLFYAGLETTSTALSWTFLYLSLHLHVQDKLFEEIKNVVGISRLPSLDDRPKMIYTEAVIMEMLRMSSFIPLGVWHRATSDAAYQNYVIPKDTTVLSNVYAVHHDPETWGDPEVFRPERFIMEDGSLHRHHPAFLPFGYGKRVCLGESLARDQLFLFISSLFQRFIVKPDPSKPMPTMEGTNGILLTPKPCEFVLQERALS